MEKREPLLDVVILVHDKADWADLCIRSVETHTRNPARIIVVDSASKKPETHAWLQDIENRGHTVVRLAENRSFSNGVNAGVAAGTAKFIVVLNDDAIVTEGWDTALLQDCVEPMVGMAGARSNYAAGPQGGQWSPGEPPFLVFVCVCIRRAIWDVVGPMDAETFDGFSSEDLDYSWRVQKAGYKLKISTAYVLHAGSRTLAETTGDTQARALNDAKYNARLVEKWGRDFVLEHTKVLGKVMVNTYSAEEWTRVAFMGAIAGLRSATGFGFSYHHMTRAPIHMARQLVCDYALDQGYDWLVQLDDDAQFPPDVIPRLLGHGKEVVCALAYQRKPPHWVCAFEVGPDGILGAPMEGIENTGLRKVDVSGFHCSVLKTSVIKKLRDAGIRQYFGGFENKVGEDFAMSLNLKKVGVQVHVDTNLISGHIGSAIVVDGQYKQSYLAQQAAKR